VKVNYVIISNNAVKDLGALRGCITMDQLIFDSSNAPHLTNKLFKQKKSIEASVYSVIHQGAFELYI